MSIPLLGAGSSNSGGGGGGAPGPPTDFLDPEVEELNDLTLNGGASDAVDALNKGIRQPTAPDATKYLSSTSDHQYVVLNLEESGADVTAGLRFWLCISSASSFSGTDIEAEFWPLGYPDDTDSSNAACGAYTGGSGWQWIYCDIAVTPNIAAIETASVAFVNNTANTYSIKAFYVEIDP